jgi:hypothetical protein
MYVIIFLIITKKNIIIFFTIKKFSVPTVPGSVLGSTFIGTAGLYLNPILSLVNYYLVRLIFNVTCILFITFSHSLRNDLLEI